MWFHTTFFVPPKEAKFNVEESLQPKEFGFSGEGKTIRAASFTFSGEKKG